MTLSGEVIHINDSQLVTVVDLKLWIESERKIPVDEQRFLIGERTLEDTDCVALFGAKKNGTGER